MHKRKEGIKKIDLWLEYFQHFVVNILFLLKSLGFLHCSPWLIMVPHGMQPFHTWMKAESEMRQEYVMAQIAQVFGDN
jgi:hypothetical protein